MSLLKVMLQVLQAPLLQAKQTEPRLLHAAGCAPAARHPKHGSVCALPPAVSGPAAAQRVQDLAARSVSELQIASPRRQHRSYLHKVHVV